MSRDPNLMLERFEAKYGTWDELLDKYCDAKHPGHRLVLIEEQEKLATKYDRLMREHTKLVWCVMGYHMGYKAANEAGGKD